MYTYANVLEILQLLQLEGSISNMVSNSIWESVLAEGVSPVTLVQKEEYVQEYLDRVGEALRNFRVQCLEAKFSGREGPKGIDLLRRIKEEMNHIRKEHAKSKKRAEI